MTFSVASTIALMIVLTVEFRRAPMLEVVVGAATIGLGLKWRLEWSRSPIPAGLDLAELVVLTLGGVALGGLPILLLLYVRISAKTLDGSVRRITLFTLGCVGAFAMSIWLGPERSVVSPIVDAALASGFCVAAPVMLLMRTTMEQLSQAQERERLQAASRESEKAFRSLFEANPQPLWVCDRVTLRFLAVNDAAAHQYGYSRQELLTMHLRDLLPEDQRHLALRSHQDRAAMLSASRHQRRDGSLIDVDVTATGVVMGSREGLLMLATDVTDRRALDAQLRHQALHDPLTGLPNRSLLAQRTEAALNSGRGGAMLVIDLAGFKAVNDTFGHAEGDAVLAAVALRLRETVRPGDTPARLGGDEFAVLLTGLEDAEEVSDIAHRIEEALQQPFYVGARSVPISCSTGIAMIVDSRTTLDEILRRADAAMYAAKRSGRRAHVVYEAGVVPTLGERLQMQQDLHAALEGSQFHLVYQPQVSLMSGRVTAVEALIRWQHPTRGEIPPDVFIPMAEQNGLIAPVTEWVLRTACAQAEAWRATGWMDIRIAVNISGRDLDNPRLIDYVTAALAVTHVEPWQLELELTETAVVGHTNALERLHALRAVGLSIAIDDFGTGYSMLSRLRALPADCIKIDRSFVHDVDHDDVAATIVRTTAEMGRKLGLTVVAEGVQSEAALQTLREFGCHAAQGYYLSRPLLPEELRRRVNGGLLSAERRAPTPAQLRDVHTPALRAQAGGA